MRQVADSSDRPTKQVSLGGEIGQVLFAERALRRAVGVAAAGLIMVAFSLPGRAEQSGEAPQGDRAIGLALLKTPQPYAGADEELLAVPIFQFRRGGFFIDGIRLGYGWALPAKGSFQIAVMPQFAELDPDASPLLEGMEKRRGSVDGMLALAWERNGITMSLAGYSDLLGRSDGQRLEGEVGLPVTAGRWRIVPAAKAVWVDADFADYYVGVRRAEVAPERPFYQGSSSLNPGVSLGVFRPIGKRLVFIGRAEALWLGSGVRDSPVVGDDTMSIVMLGVARRF